MSEYDQAPPTILAEFLTAAGAPVRLIDLGSQFPAIMGLSSGASTDTAFRIAVEKKRSKAGNAYYEYSQNSVPFPDGLNTFVRVEGAIVPLGRIHPSKTSGYPTREGGAVILVGAIQYDVTVYLTEGKSPFYVKVHAQRRPKPSKGGTKALVGAPRGGSLA